MNTGHHNETRAWAGPESHRASRGAQPPGRRESQSASRGGAGWTTASVVVVGLGKTGLSVARYLVAQGARVSVTDSRSEPPGRTQLAASGAPVVVRTGGFDTRLLEGADLVVLSPGVVPQGGFFDAVRERGIPLIGDIELFTRAARAPVAAITGTNGKSTVTTLLAQMAQRAGRAVRAGGNLGVPALDLLDAGAELYVLELSSFQLESTDSLAPAAAAVLNVTPDHLDRYPDVEAYAAAKRRVYSRCECAVINLDDARVTAMRPAGRRCLSFSLHAASRADYCVATRHDAGRAQRWLMAHGEPLLPLSALKLSGLHNAANALAALALGEALGLPREACLAALEEFSGLPHRMQWVADIAGVRYIDDSKGTNVGATLAAVAGLVDAAAADSAAVTHAVEGGRAADCPAADCPAANGSVANGSVASGSVASGAVAASPRLIVIAGGDGKGQDFAPLRDGFAGRVRCALLIGRDAGRLGEALAGACELLDCPTLPAAVARAASLARPGDTVLLSPACASLDMFRDYAHRGEVFAAAVRELSR